MYKNKYDIRTWTTGKQNSLIIGKTSKIRVGVDLITTAILLK
ncbi:hypothetical protein [Fusobacterium sp.]|nr:hypothetical protein [Fusobacterium sp.]